MLSRKARIALAVTVSLVSVLAAARALTGPASPREAGGAEAGDKGRAGHKTAEVAVLVLKAQPLSLQVQSSGTLLAREEIDISSEIQGRVDALPFREGARVKRGDLLVKLNDEEIRAQLRKVESQLKIASDKESRQRILADRDLVSREEYEIALGEKNDLAADRDLLKAKLAKTAIRAPFDGIAGLREVSVGANIAAGTRIAGLFAVDPLKIDFSVPEQYFGRIRAGDSVFIALENRADTVKGAVYAVEPRIDPATRMLRIRGYCPNPDGRLPPGASARVRIPLRSVPDAILVPSSAVIPDIRGHKVMLVRNGKAEPVSVTAGYRTEDQIQISGVSPGDSLIVSGLIRLKPGSPVRAAEERAGAEARGPAAPEAARAGGERKGKAGDGIDG